MISFFLSAISLAFRFFIKGCFPDDWDSFFEELFFLLNILPPDDKLFIMVKHSSNQMRFSLLSVVLKLR